MTQKTKQQACEETGNNHTRVTQMAFNDGWRSLEESLGLRVLSEDDYSGRLLDAAVEVIKEVTRAKKMFPANFVNQHEGYAVLLEEVDELWDEIKKNQKSYDLPAQRKEAVQAAAMLLRMIVELL